MIYDYNLTPFEITKEELINDSDFHYLLKHHKIIDALIQDMKYDYNFVNLKFIEKARRIIKGHGELAYFMDQFYYSQLEKIIKHRLIIRSHYKNKAERNERLREYTRKLKARDREKENIRQNILDENSKVHPHPFMRIVSVPMGGKKRG